MQTSGSMRPSARLNPFAFPSETDLHFLLLILLVLGASLYSYNLIYNRLWGTEYFQVVNQCYSVVTRQFGEAPVLSPDVLADEDRFQAASAANRAFQACIAPVQQARAGTMVGGMLAVFLLALALYWWYPDWKLRRGGLTPLTTDDAPGVVEELGRLSALAGLRRTPQFVWNPLDTRIDGQAFGRLGRTYVALTGGLVTQFYADLPTFRAVVLHELAHLRNADIDKTYVAITVWHAFTVITLPPLAFLLLTGFLSGGDPTWFPLSIIWRVAVMAGLVYLTRSALLRAREFYADVRASTYADAREPLARFLASLPATQATGWRGLLAMHPEPADRRQALDNPARMMRNGFWQGVAAGAAVTIALPNVEHLLWTALPVPLQPYASFLASLIFLTAAVGILGLNVWRATYAALLQRTAPPSPLLPGLGVGLGACLGLTLSLFRAIQDRDVVLPLADTGPEFLFRVSWCLLLIAGVMLLTRWLTATALIGLSWGLTRPSIRWMVGLVLGLAVIIVTVWFSGWLAWYNLGLAMVEMAVAMILGDPDGRLLALVPYLSSPVLLLTLAALWAIPLALSLARPRSGSPPLAAWVYLDAPAPAPAPLPITVGLRRPLRLALVASLVAAVLLVAGRLVTHALVPELVRSELGFAVAYNLMQIAVLGLVQALAALPLLRRPHLGVTYGLLTAFLAGCGMTVVYLAVSMLAGCVSPLAIRPGGQCPNPVDAPYLVDTFRFIINMGGLETLLVALVVRGWRAMTASGFPARRLGPQPPVSA